MAGWNGWITVESIDENKVPYSERFYVSNTSDVMTDSGTFVAALVSAYDDVIEAQIQNVWLHIKVALPGGLKSAPVSGSNNADGALEKFATTLEGEPYTYWFPAWLTAGFNAAGGHANEVLLSQAAVDTFNDFLLAASSNTQVTDEDFNLLSGTVPMKAVKSNRKQRRALGKSR